MSRVVWKYDVPLEGAVHAIPSGPMRRLLHVAAQFPDERPDVVSMWWEVDADDPPREQPFIIVGTGQEVPLGYGHLGTTLVRGGGLVWHLYGGIASAAVPTEEPPDCPSCGSYVRGVRGIFNDDSECVDAWHLASAAVPTEEPR